MDFAVGYIEKILQPHPLNEVEVRVRGSQLSIAVGKLDFRLDDLEVDPAEAYIFDAKLREARQKLAHR